MTPTQTISLRIDGVPVKEKERSQDVYFQQQQCTNFSLQKHLGLVLHRKLSFNEHVNQKMNKCNRILGLMKRLFLILSRKQLLTIYKTFVRSHLGYVHIIYDKPFYDAFE